jgi:hypothetical protein
VALVASPLEIKQNGRSGMLKKENCEIKRGMWYSSLDAFRK